MNVKIPSRKFGFAEKQSLRYPEALSKGSEYFNIILFIIIYILLINIYQLLN